MGILIRGLEQNCFIWKLIYGNTQFHSVVVDFEDCLRKVFGFIFFLMKQSLLVQVIIVVVNFGYLVFKAKPMDCDIRIILCVLLSTRIGILLYWTVPNKYDFVHIDIIKWKRLLLQ